MVGVRRLDARHKAATAHVSHAAASSLAGPSVATPPRPYHVSAAPSVRAQSPLSGVWPGEDSACMQMGDASLMVLGAAIMERRLG